MMKLTKPNPSTNRFSLKVKRFQKIYIYPENNERKQKLAIL